MSISGYSNLQHQWSIEGEYNNPDQEDLFLWIEKHTNQSAVFAGPMPIMANLRLSTGRNIVNHPHYEDAGLRARTKEVYQVGPTTFTVAWLPQPFPVFPHSNSLHVPCLPPL